MLNEKTTPIAEGGSKPNSLHKSKCMNPTYIKIKMPNLSVYFSSPFKNMTDHKLFF